eukprot:1439920-Rhodomonas_salina.1
MRYTEIGKKEASRHLLEDMRAFLFGGGEKSMATARDDEEADRARKSAEDEDEGAGADQVEAVL